MKTVKARDKSRTRWLESEGYRVLRFWNNDLVTNLDGVLETIYAALYGSRDVEMKLLKHSRRLKNYPAPDALRAPTLPLQGRASEHAAFHGWHRMTDTFLDLFPSAKAGRFGRQQKRARGARVPVTIQPASSARGRPRWCGGFLKLPEGCGTALVVNEFGSVGIDDALLRSSSDEVTLLGNGCLCCNVRSDLQIALRKLVADRDRQKIPHFGRVLIETSGLADLSPILQTFSTDRALGGGVRRSRWWLTVVDAMSTGCATSTRPRRRASRPSWPTVW